MGDSDLGVPDPSVRADGSAWSLLRAVALGPDSYGLVFLLLIGDYVLLTSGWRGSAALIVSAVWLGTTILLAFHTSRVPRRVMRVVRLAVAVVVLQTGQQCCDRFRARWVGNTTQRPNIRPRPGCTLVRKGEWVIAMK